jgi:hypothetical protein
MTMVETTRTRRSTVRAVTDDAPANALCLAVTEEMLNDLIELGLGHGRAVEPMEQKMSLPAMGDVRLRLALTITGGRVDLRAEDGNRIRAIAYGAGDVAVATTDFDGDTEAVGPMGLPAPPAPIPVRAEALLSPVVRLEADHTVTIGIDLGDAELVSLGVDHDTPVPDGVDPGVWTGMIGMIEMMFASMGGGLWDGLVEHVGSIEEQLGPEVGDVLADLGMAEGPATVTVASGLLSISAAGHGEVVGRAVPVPVAGKRVGVAVTSTGVDVLTRLLLDRIAGDLPMPFDLEVDLGEQRVGGRLRQSRLLPDRFPDLRSAVRTDVSVRLSRGRLILALDAAWLELPSLMPRFVNDVNRRIGGLVSLAPLRIALPGRVALPLGDGPDDRVHVLVDDLRVTPDGVGIVLALT